MRFPVASLSALLALWTTLAFGQSTSSPPPPSYRFTSGSAAKDTPVELVANGLVFVRAQVNDHAGWFILDNASQGFTVDRQFAQQSSLQSSGTAAARGGGANAIAAGVIRDVEITLPGLALTHRNLTAIDLKAIEPSVGHEVDGIIGSRLFDDFVVVVDYEHRMVSIYSPKDYKAPAGAKALPVRVDQHGFPYLDATIALPGIKPVSGTFLIDGGANTYADLYKPFCDAHAIPPAAMKLLDNPGTSTGGTTESRDGRAEWIGVGPYSVKQPPITFAQDTEGLMAATDYDGLIGAEFLERFTVVFDIPGKRILLTPNRTCGSPATYDESGLRIRAEGPGFHKFVVRRIVPNSAASDAGIQPGDIIVWVDNHSAEQITLTELRSVLAQPNARYSIGIVRGANHIQATLQLRPLI